METGENCFDFVRLAAEVGHGVGDGVVIFQPQQRVQFGLFQFLHAFGDVVLEDEVEEGLLLGVELGIECTRAWSARAARVIVGVL